MKKLEWKKIPQNPHATHGGTICGNLKGEEEGFPINTFRCSGSSKISWWEQQRGRASPRKGSEAARENPHTRDGKGDDAREEQNFPLLSSTPRC